MRYSFIIPVYNCKTWLPACVESIRAVKAADYEILLVDDGSTDGSGNVCDELVGKYPEVRTVHQPNGGASAARNRGIREAKGEKVIFLDADDTIDSDALGKILADPRCAEADMTIFGLTFEYYYNGKCYRRDPLFYEQEGILGKDDWSREFLRLYEKNSLFLYEDFEFVLRYMTHCETIFNVPRAVYHYRQSEDEGNAKRRLSRISCLSEFMVPIEAAVNALVGVPEEQRESVLVGLYQVLAREKISGAGLKQIEKICSDYAQWYEDRGFTDGDNGLHWNLMGFKALKLMLLDRKTVLRHKIAVWAKAHNLYKRK